MTVEGLRSRAREVQHGFKDLVAMATDIETRHADEVLRIADELRAAPEHQARMLAIIIWGDLAGQHPELITRLRDDVSPDPDWRVQEMLARSFTAWCTANGWEASVPTIASWLADPRPHVRRAATEGPRVWTSRDYFRAHPEIAVGMLRGQLDDPDDYARRSAENALRDVLKRYPRLI
ncbi:MAG: hypothetical protein JWN80_2593 [Microbacteriaceae bacterium]|nr:hypothetical protein [Microbacteriaceae bacterium]